MVPTVDGFYGSELEDGSWNGMIGMLTRNETDIGVASLSRYTARDLTVNYLVPHLFAR